MTSIELEFNCFGYFGWGTGISMFRKTAQKGITYCNICPLRKECWDTHRERARKIFPDVCKHIDELGKESDGQKKIMDFVETHGSEPYMSIMMGNIEDAIQVMHTGKVKDRGPYTLKYPFPDNLEL